MWQPNGDLWKSSEYKQQYNVQNHKGNHFADNRCDLDLIDRRCNKQAHTQWRSNQSNSNGYDEYDAEMDRIHADRSEEHTSEL